MTTSETSSPSMAESPTVALVVGPGIVDQSRQGPLAQARLLGFPVERIEQLRLVHLQSERDLSDDQIQTLTSRLLVDPVGQWWTPAVDHLEEILADGEAQVVEVGLRPGVTDREGAELVRAAAEIGIPLTAASVGRRLLLHGDLGADAIGYLADQVLHNEVVERWAPGLLTPAFVDPAAKSPGIDIIPIRVLNDSQLGELSATRRLGMSQAELAVVRDHFRQLDRDPTDGELETLAQTWSEHCSHKTFRAQVTVDGGPDGSSATIDGLLSTYLRAATDAIDAPWVRSAFVDNAGIVAFDDDHDVAIKVETHNHPSALEPFGGANTGVGGVVRDILGVSARPIAVTDILCFGPEDTQAQALPDGVLHPRRIRSGVIAGVGDYGNKIGVPTIAGAIIHDPTYTTTPLVFVGCVGILPRDGHPTSPQPGDAIVVLGGAVGRDGVGGATFSSQTMGAETADIAGSSVQIGDPIVEKGLIDVVVEARDRGLYNAITDCGAGGLSSAVGEMAEELGADVDLTLVPRKYPGLAPWEVWLSEAQERMVLATPDPEVVLALAERWQVGAAVVGHFRRDGRLVVSDGAETLVDLDTGFLHNGRPRLELDAAPITPVRPPRQPLAIDTAAVLLRLLAHPSIRSNEEVVRTYDHEVLGGTLVRPYGGVAADGPADGTVLIPPGTDGNRALAIGVGVNVVIGRYDTEAMAWAAVDEAVRNVVVAGADPDQLSLLDNFAWGNPTDPEAMARLVAACRGCHDASMAFGAPFVSGKDSLYNEFVHPDGSRDPVTPTLVITALGIVDGLDQVPLTGLVAAGDDVWLVGPLAGELGGSHLDAVVGADNGGGVPNPDGEEAERHRQLHAAIKAGLVRSAHDLSEGGLAVAAAEWAIGGRLGLDLDPGPVPDPPPGGADGPPLEVLFGEGLGRYLVEVNPQDGERFARLVPAATKIGATSAQPHVRIGPWLSIGLDPLIDAFASAAPTANSDVTP
ncbi:MAG: phosphoribosylformylglycinamidine synthase subunit PurL [Actinomycetia bacterium]|nr:phosphoribosylformylglycinamidine synthase subunit PurL [Actinomycetes bacterium]